MNDEDELTLLRRAVDRQHVDHMTDIDRRMEELANQVQLILDRQLRYEPAMDTLQTILRGAVFVKWIVVFSVGALGVFSTVITAFEAIQKVLHK